LNAIMNAENEPPALSITCGHAAPHTVSPGDAPITIGRELPAQIRIDDQRVSRTHLLVEFDGATWTATDTRSTNGTFVGGEPIDRLTITDGLTIHIGHEDGIPVSFAFWETGETARTTVTGLDDGSDDGSDDDDDTAHLTDPGVARAGTAAAARREELGFSQRKLSDDKVIGQSNLVAFERGRRWPRDSTRAKLEQALNWAPGTLTRIRYGAAIPEDDSTEVISDSVRVAVLLDALELALNGIKARVPKLPSITSGTFAAEAGVLLAELRRVQAAAAEGARSATGSEIALLLSDVRRTYNELTILAARAPDAPLSQRLYAARHHAELTVEETANASAVDSETVIAAEADRPIPPDAAAALETLIAQLIAR
jgi:pSer/pThr/pTyr-binding forkhead associated (FHA) protein